MRSELERDGRFLRLSLSPLSHVHAIELVRSLLRRGAAEASVERLGEQVWRSSEGNPFVIVETVRELLDGAAPSGASSDTVPRRVRDLVLARLERLAGGEPPPGRSGIGHRPRLQLRSARAGRCARSR